jgi:hypothetical protein
MKRILSERNIVVILFVMVLVTFSLAQEDTKKIERMFLDTNSAATSQNENPEIKAVTTENKNVIPATQLR